MRPPGTSEELARRRRLAVERVHQGYLPTDVARFLGVAPRSVFRWLAAARDYGERVGLNPRPHLGPKPRLHLDQELTVLCWLSARPTSYGFPNERWTAPRLAYLIDQRFGVHYHPRYLNQWLRERGITPQKPILRARERNPEAIQQWRVEDWLRLKKKRSRTVPPSC
jgi:transposase